MKKDIKWKNFLADNRRYADIINGIGCGGKQRFNASDLLDADTHEKGKNRDMLRKVSRGANFLMVGIENQEAADYEFPLQIMGYDTVGYQKEATEISRGVRADSAGLSSGEYLYGFRKDSRLHPQITFALYTGSAPWDGPVYLHDILDFTDIPEELHDLIADYKVNLVDIRRMENTDVFKTDVKHVIDFICCAEDKEALLDLVEQEPYFKKMDADAFALVTKYTNSKELVQAEEYDGKDGEKNMCKAIKDLMEDSRQEGMELGMEQGIEKGIEQEAFDNARNLFVNGVSYEIVRKSIHTLSDEVLQKIYNEVMTGKKVVFSGKQVETVE